LERIDHIAIVVKEIDRTLVAYEGIAGVRAGLREENPELGIRSVYITMGDVVVELMQPMGEGPLARQVDASGQGLHHIAYRVKALHSVLSRLHDRGVRVLDSDPRDEGDALCVFLNPEDTGGVLTELVQR
jgi:methylmalonyl-CoA epimerase